MKYKFGKGLITAGVAALIVTTVAVPKARAIGVIPLCLLGHGYSSDNDDQTQMMCDMGSLIPVLCAPEVAEGNLKATDRVLNDLASTSDFSDATQFKSEVKRIQALEPNARIAEYFKVAGINPSDEKQVVNFIGERAPQQKNIDALKTNLGLSDTQANKVIGSLTQALTGGIR